MSATDNQRGSAGATGSVPDLSLELSRLLGASTAKAVEKHLGITTVGGMLHQFPRRYLARGELTNINQLPVDENVTIIARVAKNTTRYMQTRKGTITDVVVIDDSGQGDGLHISFFNGYKPQKELTEGTLAMFSGKVSVYNREKTLTNPDYSLMDEAVMGDRDFELQAAMPVPVYPATAKFPSWKTQKVIEALLPALDLALIPDPIPAAIVAREKLMPLPDAYEQIHGPDTADSWPRAKNRFRFQEALALQTALAQRRAKVSESFAIARPLKNDAALAGFDATLPYTLTRGQQEIGEVISADLSAPHPMHRLLQGEVGSGKTLVALRAMLQVVDAGGQAAFLAPTEVLAAQHFASLTALLGSLGQGTLLGGPNATQLTLLTGSMPAAARKAALLKAASGEAGIVIGTHALLSENVQFADLSLVVVDEQHRFGVEQRDSLRSKANNPPHLLVMTATPIPRTVAMTVFGDLEVSELTELPSGRAPINTFVAPLVEHPQWESRVWARAREEVDAGHQVYVVCPKIGDDENEKLFEDGSELIEAADGNNRPMAGVVQMLAYLGTVPALAGVSMRELHGRLDSVTKQETMQAFAKGDVDVLVSTTVIEVGVDVHNATLMIILDAERFGMSQLHQLRGRVGRGGLPGTCLLVTRLEPDHPSRKRLEAVANTIDGFELAHIDMELRKEGDILGARQSGGQSGLRMLSVLRDEKIIARARIDADLLVAGDPELENHQALRQEIANYLNEHNEAFIERG